MHQTIKNLKSSYERVAKYSRPLALSVEIENFQSYHNPALIPLANLTIVCGPNSAGKSAILDAIELIRSVAKNLANGERDYKRWLIATANHEEPSPEQLTHLTITFTPGFNSQTYGTIEANIIENQKQFGNLTKYDETEFAIHRLFYSHDDELKDELYKDFPRDCDGRTIVNDPQLAKEISDKCHSPRVLYFKFSGNQFARRVELGIDGIHLLAIDNFSDHGIEFNAFHPLFTVSGDTDDAKGLRGLARTWQEFANPIANKEGMLKLDEGGEYWDFDENNKIDTSALFGDIGTRELITQASILFCTFSELAGQSLELNKVPGLRNTPNSLVVINKLVKQSDTSESIWETLARDLAEASLAKTVNERTSSDIEKLNQALCHEDDRNIGLKLGYKLEVSPNLSMTVEEFISLTRSPDTNGKFESLRKHLGSVALHVTDQVGRQLQLSDVGTGVSQVIPVLWSAISSSLTGVVHVQQPELHLHPALQMRLADQFLQHRDGKELTWIIETHSEHFILRILKRIRQTTKLGILSPLQIHPNEVVVLYIWKDPDSGSRVAHMKITQDGDFEDRWPHGFFEERADEWLD